MKRWKKLGEVAGRQPVPCYIDAMRPYCWHGIEIEGEVLTREQLAAVSAAGMERDKVELVRVRREAGHREMVFMPGSPPPVFEFDCPLVRVEKDGRFRVIARSGAQRLIQPDGWVRPPRGGAGSLFGDGE